MSHGIPTGDYKVALIGGVQEHEKQPGFFSKLFKSQTPEARRARREAIRHAKSLESPGRPVGTVVGSWITDLAELRHHVLLCWACAPKFDAVHKRYGYFKDNRWSVISGGVNGACDGCRAEGRDPRRGLLQLFVHESYVGHSYMPF